MDAVPQITSYLFTQGVLGVAVLVLGTVCVFLYRRVDKERTAKDLVQESRLQDAKDFVDTIKGPLEKQGELAQRIYDMVSYNDRSRNR